MRAPPPVTIPGYEVPLHAALGSPILLGGVPRGLAILNGTLAAAIGLGLQQWLPGMVLWLAGHSAAALAARRDPHIAAVALRHLRQRSYLAC